MRINCAFSCDLGNALSENTMHDSGKDASHGCMLNNIKNEDYIFLRLHTDI